MIRQFPLQWPEGWGRTPPGKRKEAQFKVPPGQGQKEMLKELSLLGARDVVVSSDQRINRDGSLSAQRYTLEDPGVAVYFTRKGRQTVLACDRFDDLHANVRAIGKTVEAMRGIERWGASDMLDRAFIGFEALPAPEQWWQTLGVNPLATAEEINAAYRAKAKDAHPDKTRDDGAAMARLNTARDQAQRILAERGASS